MTRTGQNAQMWSGDDITLSVTVRDETGTAVNLSGGVIAWTLVTLEGVVVLSKTGVITNAAGGVFQIVLAAADTANLAGVYRHEAQLTQGGVVSTLLTGTITIEQDYIV